MGWASGFLSVWIGRSLDWASLGRSAAIRAGVVHGAFEDFVGQFVAGHLEWRRVAHLPWIAQERTDFGNEVVRTGNEIRDDVEGGPRIGVEVAQRRRQVWMFGQLIEGVGQAVEEIGTCQACPRQPFLFRSSG